MYVSVLKMDVTRQVERVNNHVNGWLAGWHVPSLSWVVYRRRTVWKLHLSPLPPYFFLHITQVVILSENLGPIPIVWDGISCLSLFPSYMDYSVGEHNLKV